MFCSCRYNKIRVFVFLKTVKQLQSNLHPLRLNSSTFKSTYMFLSNQIMQLTKLLVIFKTCQLLRSRNGHRCCLNIKTKFQWIHETKDSPKTYVQTLCCKVVRKNEDELFLKIIVNGPIVRLVSLLADAMPFGVKPCTKVDLMSKLMPSLSFHFKFLAFFFFFKKIILKSVSYNIKSQENEETKTHMFHSDTLAHCLYNCQLSTFFSKIITKYGNLEKRTVFYL